MQRLSCRGVPLLTLATILLLAVWAAAVSGAAAQEGPTRVRVDPVTVEPLAQTVPVLGRIVPRRTGEVAARIDGPIEHFEVEVGDRVGEGEVIARLNTEILSAIRDQRAGEWERAKAELAVRRAELELNQQELERLTRLRESAAFSQARFDDKRQEVNINQARVQAAQSALTTARALLDLAEIHLRYAEIRAPYEGVITQRMNEEGAYVQSGTALVRMMSDRRLEVEADVPSSRLSGLHPGREVVVVLDNGTRYPAVVRAIVPAENPLSRTRPVRLIPDFRGSTNPLAAEQSVTVEVPVGEQRDIVTVHKDAVIQGPNGALVFVVAGDEAERRSVTLGEAVGSRFEVLSGLEAGEKVVVRGNERLRPGEKVVVEEGQG